ncbi:unnamed protein product [Meloidogyne enterolobii]|uniref:Uncharacterized protein n=2 Tax=Meloidogyne enterolobii TaxID=390850 RepID=A0ACB0XMB5_MELEN|nr:unnamed protein product [Meloidogyne enterolobii]
MRDPETSFIQSRKSLERKIFKVRRNVFPPILTNRAPQNSTNNKRSSKNSIKDSKKVRFHVSEPSSSYSQSSGDISSSSNDDQEVCHQNIPSSSLNSNKNLSNNEEITAKFTFETKNNFYFKYFIKKNFEKDEDEMSDLSCSSNNSSNYVENEWSDLEENNQRSRESEEAELKERFKEAFSQLSKGEYEKTAQICTSILIHPIMQNFYVSDWEAFDWIENKRKKEIGSIIHSDMAKIYFNINLALIGILDNSLDFYIQVFLFDFFRLPYLLY